MGRCAKQQHEPTTSLQWSYRQGTTTVQQGAEERLMQCALCNVRASALTALGTQAEVEHCLADWQDVPGVLGMNIDYKTLALL
jgi:hypothetical protein